MLLTVTYIFRSSANNLTVTSSFHTSKSTLLKINLFQVWQEVAEPKSSTVQPDSLAVDQPAYRVHQDIDVSSYNIDFTQCVHWIVTTFFTECSHSVWTEYTLNAVASSMYWVCYSHPTHNWKHFMFVNIHFSWYITAPISMSLAASCIICYTQAVKFYSLDISLFADNKKFGEPELLLV